MNGLTYACIDNNILGQRKGECSFKKEMHRLSGLLHYCDVSINSNKINNSISHVRILWNALINDFSRKGGEGGVFDLLPELFEN